MSRSTQINLKYNLNLNNYALNLLLSGCCKWIINSPAPSRVQHKIYTTSAKREFDGMGWDGTDGPSKASFNFLHTFWVNRSCLDLLIQVIKYCHQHSYGFQNLMSSWGVGILFSKFLLGNVFLKNHAQGKDFR